MKSEKNSVYQHLLEWEAFKWPIQISSLQSQCKHYDLPQNSIMAIERNEEYGLRVELSGHVSDPKSLDYTVDSADPVAGQFFKGDTVTGYDIYGVTQYTIYGFTIRKTRFISLGPSQPFTAEIEVDRIKESNLGINQPTAQLLESYLSSKIGSLFPRSTDRAKEERYYKLRQGIDPDKKEFNLISHKTHGGSRDYLLVETSEFQFVIQVVDKNFLPK